MSNEEKLLHQLENEIKEVKQILLGLSGGAVTNKKTVTDYRKSIRTKLFKKNTNGK